MALALASLSLQYSGGIRWGSIWPPMMVNGSPWRKNDLLSYVNGPAAVGRLGGGKPLASGSRATRADLVRRSSFILTAVEIVKQATTEEASDQVSERLQCCRRAASYLMNYPLGQVTSCISQPCNQRYITGSQPSLQRSCSG